MTENNVQIERSIAELILSKNIIYVLEETEEFCMYIGGLFLKGQRVYTKIRDKINMIAKNTIIRTASGEKPYTYNNSKRNTILEIIKSESFISLKDFDKESHYICCKNGIYSFIPFEVIGFEALQELDQPEQLTLTEIDKQLIKKLHPLHADNEINKIERDPAVIGKPIKVEKDFITYKEYIKNFKEPYKNFIQFPIIYNPEAKCPNMEKFLEDVFGIEAVSLIYEILAYMFMPHVKYQKAFIIYGHPSTGKTTFLDMLYEFFNGEEYFSKQSLQNLGKQYQAINLMGKIGNVFDDLTAHNIGDSFMFRQVVTNRNIQSEKKYVAEEVKWYNRCKLIYATNILPAVNKKEGDQFFRRWIILACYVIFMDAELMTDEDNEDPTTKVKDYDMFDKITTVEEFSGFLNNIIEGWVRLEKRGKFSKEWNNIEYIKGLWLLDANPVKLFVDECCLVGEGESADYNMFYHTLNKFRVDHGVKAISKHMCTQWLQRIEGIEKKKKGSNEFYYSGISIKGDVDTSHNRLFVESVKNKKVDDF